ncbi:MAG: ferritin [Salinivirgaceae bacterium]|jgi:ferritin|nr:ferritin [Bacteroidales bacterium]
MISSKLESAINEQINAELWSGYMYLSMSAYFEEKGLTGFAKWMRLQAEEEKDHAYKFFDYVNERGARVILKPIAKVPTTWKNPLDVMKETLNHEKHVTSLIYKLMDLAIAEKDYATQSFLNWFIDEQVEEEASASDIVTRLEMISDSKNGLFMLDRELGSRE